MEEEEEDLDLEQGSCVGWRRKNSYETYIRSCSAMQRVELGWGQCNGDTGERDDR